MFATVAILLKTSRARSNECLCMKPSTSSAPFASSSSVFGGLFGGSGLFAASFCCFAASSLLHWCSPVELRCGTEVRK